jgi:isoleucyl-tRNA synthetase
VRISDQILDQVSEIYRRLRNSLFKFILANISDFDLVKNQTKIFSEADNFVLSQLKTNYAIIIKAYQAFKYNIVIETINNHVIELSA